MELGKHLDIIIEGNLSFWYYLWLFVIVDIGNLGVEPTVAEEFCVRYITRPLQRSVKRVICSKKIHIFKFL